MGHTEPILRLARRIGARPGFPVADKTVLVTGASSGIGRAAALRLAAHGAHVLVVARREDELAALVADIEQVGKGVALPCDLADPEATERLAADVNDRYGGVDVLVNNAALSIRRPVTDALDRLHDYERTIRLNYLAAVQLTLAFLPGMLARGGGRIVNVGTWGIPGGTMPRFTAYHASKSALTSFGRSLNAELSDRNVRVSAVHFPLVHTPMAAPTAKYRGYPALSLERAAQWILDAIDLYPVEVMPVHSRILRGLAQFSARGADHFVRKGI